MFRITQDPSSGSLLQCLDKNYKNDSIVFVYMDKVGVMAAYSGPHNGSEYAALTPTLPMQKNNT